VAHRAQRHGRGTGWIVFAGVLMLLAGGNMFINGLWALHASNQEEKAVGDTLLFASSNLDTWGWIYVIVGAAVFVAGITVFFRSLFGVWVGIIAALVQAFLAFFWIFSPYWPGRIGDHRPRCARDLRAQQSDSDEGLRGHGLGRV
jgi:uncharacterized membrane protein HdeD (DUF308 family)